MPAIRRSFPAALGAAALAVLLGGCGAGGDGSGGAAPGGAAAPTTEPVPAVTKDDALAGMVPQSVSSDGVLKFGVDASYPPNEFTDTDGTTIIGMDVDLGTAIAQKLGLKAQFENTSFDGIIPGVDAASYEMAMSSFTINDERVKTVDMISYFSAGTSIAVAAGNPQNVNPDDLCGLAIGVQRGTVQVDDLVARNEACKAAGKPEIQMSELQQQTDVTLALTANRIVAMLADSPVVAYAVSTTQGAVEQLGATYDTAPYGVVIKKGQAQYPEAVRGALQALIEDGTYEAILEKWNVSDGAITTAEIRS
ncbi:ABC transporter substrate-binding protein [Pseudonocardia cypriaca]|uniref:Polar amino acid transport system substrate-binding protein n=1 Tax=Pseudonocardia cypriaca TaxID=882449 RepID=A0A543FPZ8_9PSEU|nr:ABC transporter substrate-binding protein [Pseudonocardia cypriaca]TQM35908.1 polar amino acid transport system substrate-binding protein [Pseudonocardia cypriaca]